MARLRSARGRRGIGHDGIEGAPSPGPARRHHWRGARRARAEDPRAASARPRHAAGRRPRAARSRRPARPVLWPPGPLRHVANVSTHASIVYSAAPGPPPMVNVAVHSSLPSGTIVTSCHPQPHRTDRDGEAAAPAPWCSTVRYPRDAASASWPSAWMAAATTTRSPGVRLIGKRPPSISGLTCSTMTRCARRSGNSAARCREARAPAGADGASPAARRAAAARGFAGRVAHQGGSSRPGAVAQGGNPWSVRDALRGRQGRGTSILEPHARPPEPALSSDCVCRRARHLQRGVDALHPRAGVGERARFRAPIPAIRPHGGSHRRAAHRVATGRRATGVRACHRGHLWFVNRLSARSRRARDAPSHCRSRGLAAFAPSPFGHPQPRHRTDTP